MFVQQAASGSTIWILMYGTFSWQEYLQMPREGFQKVLLSAENDAVERFISLMHRSWPRIQVSENAYTIYFYVAQMYHALWLARSGALETDFDRSGKL